jgi:hypothetical protein
VTKNGWMGTIRNVAKRTHRESAAAGQEGTQLSVADPPPWSLTVT